MKVLVATTQTQGQRPNDFAFVSDGEMVMLGAVCDRDRNATDDDGGCGCGRSFTGVVSARGTTTATVVEMGDRGRTTLTDLLELRLMDRRGPRTGHTARTQARQLLALAATFPVGAVVELRGGRVQVRQVEQEG